MLFSSLGDVLEIHYTSITTNLATIHVTHHSFLSFRTYTHNTLLCDYFFKPTVRSQVPSKSWASLVEWNMETSHGL